MERRSSTNSESSIEPNEISSSNKTLSSDANSSLALKTSHESDSVESDENEDYINNNTCNKNTNKDTKTNISDNDIVRRDNLRQLMDKMLQKKIMSAEKTSSGNSTETSLDLSGNYNSESKTTNQSAENMKYTCPICDEISLTQHEFTTHIRNHNNVRDSSDDSTSFTCRICSKVLSSASSLDRHVLVHTGERPFTCKYCHLTFTTNGNMHRHMRTHKQHDNKTESYESDGSTDSSGSSSGGRKLIKNHVLNNNFPHKRKSVDEEQSNSFHKRKNRALSFNSSNNGMPALHQKFCCPVCIRNDFHSMIELEDHMDKEHPTIPAKCRHCEVVFKSHKALNAHRCGSQKPQNVTSGFKDLTFFDFSSTKFPVIAKAVCEQNIHTSVTSQKFECPKCLRAFPCANSVEIHIKECNSFAHDFSVKRQRQSSESEEDVKRDDFFANLALQNRSTGTSISDVPTTPSSTADKSFTSPSMLLKDIKQEMRSTPPFYPFFNENRDFADIESIIKATSSGGLDKPIPEKEAHLYNKEEEEVQDAFTAEFRKMKMRGEFPCRLCTMIFPNLRALKGHNRVHLSAAGPGPYRCNMCPHSINDKAALIRHMRTHNGDRPYECALCNYAFTTKANCERHLRNRHGKSTREDVKKAIIYHPSEDSSCDDHTKKMQMFNTPGYERDRLNMSGSMDDHLSGRSTPVSHLKEILHSRESINPHVRIQVKSLEKLNSFQDAGDEQEERPREHRPMDLSMDALDLSKKPGSHYDDGLSDEDDIEDEENMDDSEERMPEIPKFDLSLLKENPHLFLMQQPFFNEAMSKLDATQYFQLAQMYRAFGFPAPGFPIHPALLLQNPLMASSMNDMKNLFQKDLSPPTPPQPTNTSISGGMSGGSLIVNPFVSPDSSPTGPNSQGIRNMEHSPVSSNQMTIPPFPPTPQESPKKIPTPNHQPLTPQSIQNHNGPVKMVIKNGVLMPKQKQRRYRTERPFACEHCSARFTLRSNMERHIKQQHPQFWAQRQRGSHNLLRRATPTQSMNTPMMPTLANSTFGGISEQVKYAILAQQLKSRESPKNLMPQFSHSPHNLGMPMHHSPQINHNANINEPASPKSSTPAINDDDDPKLIIDEEYQAEDLSKSSDSATGIEKASAARKVAEGILEQAMRINSTSKIIDLRENKNFETPQTLQNGESKEQEPPKAQPVVVKEEANDLASVTRLVDNATNQMMFSNYFNRPEPPHPDHSDEEGLVASGSASESNNSGTDDPNPSNQMIQKKKSAYSLAPNRVSCPYCQRKFPWSSSLRRHVLTHTGQKPFKCSQCPLLFTTKSNCDRHLLRKHGNVESASSIQIPIDEMPEPVKEPVIKAPNQTEEPNKNIVHHQTFNIPSNLQMPPQLKSESNLLLHQVQSASNTVSSSDLPYKCHLCDGSFPDRVQCLEHIKMIHSQDFAILMSKVTLETDPDVQGSPDDDDVANHNLADSKSGKYPDYANRKVICAFCLRRFWSTEDLRRHMRTHSGERPFQCDICLRKFTLKHSMLRHRKKHSGAQNINPMSFQAMKSPNGEANGLGNPNLNHSASDLSDDEQMTYSSNQKKLMKIMPDMIPINFFSQINQHLMNNHVNNDKNNNSNNNNNENQSDNIEEKQHAIPSNIQAALNAAFLEKLSTLQQHLRMAGADGEGGSDLIGNLLGINDQGILNKVFNSSSEEAARLLGVEK